MTHFFMSNNFLVDSLNTTLALISVFLYFVQIIFYARTNFKKINKAVYN